jgi:hypothetical protein
VVNSKARRLEVLGQNGQRLGIAAGGLDPKAVIGDPSPIAALVDGDSLYLAGPAGAVFRDPTSRRSIAIDKSEGIDRWEKLGKHVLAWQGDRAFRLAAKGQLRFEEIGTAGSSVVLGPDREPWISAGGKGAFSLRSLADMSVVLFGGNGRLGEELRDAAPVDTTGILLADDRGNLNHYDTKTRSLNQVERGGSAPPTWRFARVGKEVYIVKTEQNGRRELRRLGKDRFSTESIATDLRGVASYPGGIAWIDSREVVSKVEAGGPPQPSTIANLGGDELSVTEVLSGPGVVTAVAGGQAYGIDPVSGKVSDRTEGVTRLMRAGRQAVGVRETPQGQQFVAIGSGPALSSERFQRIRAGNSVALG